MPAIAVPAFALAWWLGCHLAGRDPAAPAGRRAAAALIAYARGVVAWTVAPGSTTAEVLLALPALFWAGAAVALLPAFVPERRQIELGWLFLSAAFVLISPLLPAAGRLVVLAPLIGGLSLLWRFRDQVEPPLLPLALSVMAVLYGIGLVMLFSPTGFSAAEPAIGAIGIDLLVAGYLVAVAGALDLGERLRPDLVRSLVAAIFALLVVGGPAMLTMLSHPHSRAVAILQFMIVAVGSTVAGLIGPLVRLLDRVAFWPDERLRRDRSELLLLSDALPRRRERHKLVSTSPADFLRFVRHALDSYGDLGRLIRNPLTDLPAVDQRLSGRVEQPLARALELRAVLREAVERMRPAGDFATDERWRHYNALHYCCVLGLRPYRKRLRTDELSRDAREVVDWIRGYVPRHLLRRWQSEAAATVAERLWRDMVRSDPRWLTRVPSAERPSPTRST